jgi:hypothetical protein
MTENFFSYYVVEYTLRSQVQFFMGFNRYVTWSLMLKISKVNLSRLCFYCECSTRCGFSNHKKKRDLYFSTTENST